MECPAIVNDTVCVEANVTIKPDVDVGDTHWCLVGRPKIKLCNGCVYMVSQMLCVSFPLKFSAEASATTTGISCNITEVQK